MYNVILPMSIAFILTRAIAIRGEGGSILCIVPQRIPNLVPIRGPREVMVGVLPWVLPPLSNSWITVIIWLYLALSRTPSHILLLGGGTTQVLPNPNPNTLLNPDAARGLAGTLPRASTTRAPQTGSQNPKPKCRPIINEPSPFKGLDIRIPTLL